MINRILITFLIVFTSSCELRAEINQEISIKYHNEKMKIEIELNKIKKVKKKSWEKGDDYKYFYYGVMTSYLSSGEKPQELILAYQDKESKIYPDTIVSVSDFWERSGWNSEGFRKDNVYVVFDDPDVNWDLVKIIAKTKSKQQF